MLLGTSVPAEITFGLKTRVPGVLPAEPAQPEQSVPQASRNSTARRTTRRPPPAPVTVLPKTTMDTVASSSAIAAGIPGDGLRSTEFHW